MAKTKEIKSLTKFIEFIEKNCKEDTILFRGQQQDWSLLPKIARLETRERLRPTEYEMIRYLQRTGHPYTEHIQFHNDKGEVCIEPLAFAQHNGMATRLLDWTSNPLTALWFAVKNTPAKKSKNKLLDGVVWIFIPDEKCEYILSHGSAFPNDGIYIHKPNHVTPQITAQQAWFTLHGYDEDAKGFIPMEEHSPYSEHLIKLIIPAISFCEIRYQLDRCGINEATMFPGIIGLCKFIEWFHTILDDEVDNSLTNQPKTKKSKR